MKDKHAIVIPPISLLKQCSTRHHLVLTHLYATYPAYRDFYKERKAKGDFVIQDNGAAELKKSVMPSSLIEVAKDLLPDIIVAPDVIYDKEFTLGRTMAFMEENYFTLKECGIKVMAVPQGQTPDEWYECFEVFNRENGIDWLGISMFYTPKFTVRNSALKQIAHMVTKPCHLLGLWDDPSALRYECSYDFVYSVDTAKPIEFAIEGLRLRDWARHQHIDDDWYFTLGRDMRGNFSANCLTNEAWELIRANLEDYISLVEQGKPLVGVM